MQYKRVFKLRFADISGCEQIQSQKGKLQTASRS